jgi:menaquinone-dependent protoporphyrinogen oxidase
VCGAAASSEARARAEAEGYATGFLQKTGWRPATVMSVAGTIAYTRYDPLTRFVLKLIARRNKGETDTSRDWEYTDWAAVEAFARRLAAEADGATPR